MINHVVVWKLKEHAEGASREENARRIKEALEGLKGKIKHIRRLEVGINSGSDQSAWDVVLLSEFSSRSDFETYANHPPHKHADAFIQKAMEHRAVVDY